MGDCAGWTGDMTASHLLPSLSLSSLSHLNKRRRRQGRRTGQGK